MADLIPASPMPTVLLRSEERFSRNAETDLVCRLLLEKKNHTSHNYNSLLRHRTATLRRQLEPQRILCSSSRSERCRSILQWNHIQASKHDRIVSSGQEHTVHRVQFGRQLRTLGWRHGHGVNL